jgi:hypothetical protein
MCDPKETKGKVENKANVKVALSWGILWFAGMLFTIGFAPYPAGLDFWSQAGRWFLYFIVWPLIPGQKIGSPPV